MLRYEQAGHSGSRAGAARAKGFRALGAGILLGALLHLPAQARDSKWVVDPAHNSIAFDPALAGDPQPAGHCCWAPHAYMQGLKMYMVVTSFQDKVDETSSFRCAGINVGGDIADTLPTIKANGAAVNFGTFGRLAYDGTFSMTSNAVQGLRLTRTFFTTYNQWAGYQELRFKNEGAAPIQLEVGAFESTRDATSEARNMGSQDWKVVRRRPAASLTLAPGADTSLPILYLVYRAAEKEPVLDFAREKATWLAFVHRITNDHLRLETPDSNLNVTFALQKLRVAMMPCTTYVGPLATTGDGYAPGVWANDNIDYFLPLAPFLGDSVLNLATVNNMKVWQAALARDPREVVGSYEGPNLDGKMFSRGDDAMMLGSAPLAILGLGDPAKARDLWSLIPATEKCLAGNTDATKGIVHSCTDEGEDRWSCGPMEPASRWDPKCQATNAQVSTNAMGYAGYMNGANLAQALGYADTASKYRSKGAALGQAIETIFGADIQGYHTYRFHEGLGELRGWMGHPLNVGIYGRAQGTLDALFSPAMWDSVSGVSISDKTGHDGQWVRQTMYVLRAAFAAGDEDRGLAKLGAYVRNSLLGQANAPNMREDAVIASGPLIYARIFTEGLFGMKAVGFSAMECTPRLPKAWPAMAFRHVKLFGKDFDVEVKRAGTDLNLRILSGGKTLVDKTGAPGTTYTIDLANATATTNLGGNARLTTAAGEIRVYGLDGRRLYRGGPEGWERSRGNLRPGLYLIVRPGQGAAPRPVPGGMADRGPGFPMNP